MISHFSIKCQASSKVDGTAMYRCGLSGGYCMGKLYDCGTNYYCMERGISKDTVEEMMRQKK